MSQTVRFKLHKDEIQYVRDFCNQVGLPLDVVAKQALFMTMKNTYAKAEKQHAEKLRADQIVSQARGADDGSRDAASGDATGVTETVQPGEDANPPGLPNSEASGDPQAPGPESV